MNTTTLKRSKFFKGMAIESTAILPYVNWMSIHGTDLAPAAAYERGCKLRKEEPDQASLKAKIGGPMVGLQAHTLTNGLKVVTINCIERRWSGPLAAKPIRNGRLVCNAEEYAGIVELEGAGNNRYKAVTRTARILSNACLGDGFMLRHVSGDHVLGSVYSRITKSYSTAPSKEISLEYSIQHWKEGVIELLDFQCTVTGAVRTERLIVDGGGQARTNQVLIGGKDHGTSAVQGLRFIVKRVVADIAKAVAAGEDFTLRDMED
jgi:hypothetical protein